MMSQSVNQQVSQPSHLSTVTKAPMLENEYEELMYQIESMRGNSQLKQAKKEELALIAEGLLNEQKNKEELWEKMQIRKKEELSNRALGTIKATEKMLEDNLEKKSLDKKALKGLLWKNFANRIGD